MREVVVVGAARSGTKIMRDTLATAFGWGRVPYDIEYVWHASVETKHDGFGPEDLDQEAVRYIRRFIQKYGLGHRAVVEKTVGNTLRVPAVYKVFPDALFVHLVRDGVDVVESAVRQWQAPTDYSYVARKFRHFPLDQVPTYGVDYLRKAIRRGRTQVTPVWGPRYEGIEKDARTQPLEVVCARQWNECVASAITGLARVPEAQVVNVRYEDFVQDPHGVLGAIESTVGITCGDNARKEALSMIEPSSATATRSRQQKLSSPAVAGILDPQLRELGYAPVGERPSAR